MRNKLSPQDERALELGRLFYKRIGEYIKNPIGVKLIVPVQVLHKIIRVEIEPEWKHKYTGIWDDKK